MNIPNGVDMESGLIHSVEITAAKVNYLAPGGTFDGDEYLDLCTNWQLRKRESKGDGG